MHALVHSELFQLGFVQWVINIRNNEEHIAIKANGINKFKRKLDIFIAKECYTENVLRVQQGVSDVGEADCKQKQGTSGRFLPCSFIYLTGRTYILR